MPDVIPRIVHLVRDSRGVAFSWTKRMLRSEATSEPASYMQTFKPWQSGLVWTAKNMQHELMKVRGVRHLYMSYECLVCDARGEIGRLLDYVGVQVPDDDLAFLGGDIDSARITSFPAIPCASGAVPCRCDSMTSGGERCAPVTACSSSSRRGRCSWPTAISGRVQMAFHEGRADARPPRCGRYALTAGASGRVYDPLA